jgi:SAM-dependent methyltransferase
MTRSREQTKLFDPYSDRYDQAVNQAIAFSGLELDFFVRVKAEYLLDMLKQHFGSSARIDLLDVGCGIGNYHQYWMGRVGSISGVDVSKKSVARAAERNPGVQYQAYDGEQLPFADASFDAVVTICVVHHVDPPKRPKFVSELRRVLRPGGLAVVFEHNPSNVLTRRVVSNCEFDEGVELLPRQETEELMIQAGLIEPRSRFILSIPAFTTLLRKLDGLLSGLKWGAQYATLGKVSPDAHR